MSTNCDCIAGRYSTVVSGNCDLFCDFKYGTCEDGTGYMKTCSDPNRDPLKDCQCVPGYF